MAPGPLSPFALFVRCASFRFVSLCFFRCQPSVRWLSSNENKLRLQVGLPFPLFLPPPLFFVRGRTKADRRAGGTLFCGKALEGERSLEVGRALGVERSDGSGWLQMFEVPGMVSNECSGHTMALSLRGEPVCPEPEPSVTTGSAQVIPSFPRAAGLPRPRPGSV